PLDPRRERRRRRAGRALAARRARGAARLVPGPGRRGLRALGAGADARGVPRRDHAARCGGKPMTREGYPIERWRETISGAYEGRVPLDDAAVRGAVEGTVAALDCGDLRVAEPVAGAADDAASPGDWIVHGWIQQALALYFRLRVPKTLEAGPLEFHDKIPLKRNLAAAGVRVVPPGVVRYGAFLEPGVIVMPAYVNIGARVGEGTMVDTWATVGSCAQIGRRV